MPIYEYVCANCGQELEVIQKFSDAPLKECPECKELSLDKKTSVSAFHLKGGGWYKDGYGASKSSDSSKTTANGDKNNQPDSKAKNNKDNASKPPKTEDKAKSANVPSSKAS